MADLVPADKFSRLPERYQRRAREIARRVSDIDALCALPTTDEIGEALKRLRGQLRPQPDTDVREMAEGFKASCRDIPAWAISEAANDFLAGRVDNHTGQFMPTCAEFAKQARAVLLPFLSERSALRIEASKLVERAEDDARRHRIAMERQDPAVRARTAQLIADATKGAAKALPMRHAGISDEVKAKLDTYRKPRSFVSKIEQQARKAASE